MSVLRATCPRLTGTSNRTDYVTSIYQRDLILASEKHVSLMSPICISRSPLVDNSIEADVHTKCAQCDITASNGYRFSLSPHHPNTLFLVDFLFSFLSMHIFAFENKPSLSPLKFRDDKYASYAFCSYYCYLSHWYETTQILTNPFYDKNANCISEQPP